MESLDRADWYFRLSNRLLIGLFVLCLCLGAPALTRAQDNSGGSNEPDANNPIAKTTMLQIENFLSPDVKGITDGDAPDNRANTLNLYGIFPITLGEANFINRITVPVVSAPDPTGGSELGLGDTTLLTAYLFDTPSGVSAGIGPAITAPTASDELLGTDKWLAGGTAVYFNASNPKVQYGGLLIFQVSFAGKDDREDITVGTFQPFLFYQLGQGTYLRSSAIMEYEFESDRHRIPLGLGVGQVFPAEKGIWNFYVEPQVTLTSDGVGQPTWTILGGILRQF